MKFLLPPPVTYPWVEWWNAYSPVLTNHILSSHHHRRHRRRRHTPPHTATTDGCATWSQLPDEAVSTTIRFISGDGGGICGGVTVLVESVLVLVVTVAVAVEEMAWYR